MGLTLESFFLEDASLSRLLSVIFGQNVVSGSFASVLTLAFKIQIDSFIFPSGSASNMQEYHCDSSTKLHLFSIVTSSGRAKGVGWTKYGLWFGWRKEIAAKEVQIYLRLPLCLSKSMVIGLAKKRPLALDPFNSILMICQDYTIVSGTSKYPTLPWSKWKLDFRNRPRGHLSFDQNCMHIFYWNWYNMRVLVLFGLILFDLNLIRSPFMFWAAPRDDIIQAAIAFSYI